ncbi:MAG TPA: PHP domain-containing protein [Pantanalinema sp.]
MKADLHLHTTCSDGRLSPEALVLAAARAGLSAIAVTDHDNTDAVAEAMAAVAERGLKLEVVPGVEVTAMRGDTELHILGYFVDPRAPGWQEAMARARREREQRAAAFVAKFAAHGIRLGLDAVQRHAGDGAIGRPHVARALVEAGACGTEQQAFDRYLNPGCPTFVPRGGMDPKEAIALIHAAGGVASLAHPRSVPLSEPDAKGETLLAYLVACGLDALEVIHPSATSMLRAHYARLAAENGLLVTGGSDDHGPRPGHPSRIGDLSVPYSWLAALGARRPRSTGEVSANYAGPLRESFYNGTIKQRSQSQ